MNFGAKIQIFLHFLCDLYTLWFLNVKGAFFCSFCVIAFIFAKPQKQNFAVAFNKNEMQQNIWKFNFRLFSNFLHLKNYWKLITKCLIWTQINFVLKMSFTLFENFGIFQQLLSF